MINKTIKSILKNMQTEVVRGKKRTESMEWWEVKDSSGRYDVYTDKQVGMTKKKEDMKEK